MAAEGGCRGTHKIMQITEIIKKDRNKLRKAPFFLRTPVREKLRQGLFWTPLKPELFSVQSAFFSMRLKKWTQLIPNQISEKPRQGFFERENWNWRNFISKKTLSELFAYLMRDKSYDIFPLHRKKGAMER